tara:strand:+ start:295 stop:1206 length:912 start_codon:yes stop_codon:yes gene_type:complete
MNEGDNKEFQEDPWPKQDENASDQNEAENLILNLDGFEGPIDLLLTLARDQKVDLTKISILALVKQYLLFIDHARQIKLELAADYLVMAAWLAYLKSRLLLPKEDKQDDTPDAEEMAEALAFQLQRLEAIQMRAREVFARPKLGQDVFLRGMPEGLKLTRKASFDCSLYDLIRSYGDIQRRTEHSEYRIAPFKLMSLDNAIERMTRMLGQLPKKGRGTVWTALDQLLPDDSQDALMSRSAMASLFTAGLELSKQGQIELRQDGAFKPIYLRGRPPEDHDDLTQDETTSVAETEENEEEGNSDE